MSHLFRRARILVPYIQHHQIYANKSISHFSRLRPSILSYHHNSSYSTSPQIQQTTAIDASASSSSPQIETKPHRGIQGVPLTRANLHEIYRRWHRWAIIRVVIFFGVIIGVIYYLWDHPNELMNIKNYISKIFSDVSTSTLNQKELQIQATEYSKQMIKDIFNDETMQKETQEFFVQILSEKDFLETVSVLLKDLFSRDIMIDSVKQLVIDVFDDESVKEQCKILIGYAISADENKEILMNTLHEILNDKELTDHASQVANKTIKDVLDDDDIRLLSATFLQHVLNDDSVQQTSSDSLYKIFVGALTPKMFKKKKKKTMIKTVDNVMIDDDDQDIIIKDHVPHKHIDMDNIVDINTTATTVSNNLNQSQNEGVSNVNDNDMLLVSIEGQIDDNDNNQTDEEEQEPIASEATRIF